MTVELFQDDDVIVADFTQAGGREDPNAAAVRSAASALFDAADRLHHPANSDAIRLAAGRLEDFAREIFDVASEVEAAEITLGQDRILTATLELLSSVRTGKLTVAGQRKLLEAIVTTRRWLGAFSRRAHVTLLRLALSRLLAVLGRRPNTSRLRKQMRPVASACAPHDARIDVLVRALIAAPTGPPALASNFSSESLEATASPLR